MQSELKTEQLGVRGARARRFCKHVGEILATLLCSRALVKGQYWRVLMDRWKNKADS